MNEEDLALELWHLFAVALPVLVGVSILWGRLKTEQREREGERKARAEEVAKETERRLDVEHRLRAVEDKVAKAESDAATNAAEAKKWRSDVYEALRDIRETLGTMRQQMISDHAALSERLTRLEATGCEPARRE